MTKIIEAILILVLLLFSFFLGVRYSEKVKEHASWMFETKEEEVELPDLSGGSEYGDPESGSSLEDGNQDPSEKTSGAVNTMDSDPVENKEAQNPGSI